jgi:hypothetical protein
MTLDVETFATLYFLLDTFASAQRMENLGIGIFMVERETFHKLYDRR